MQYDQIKPYIKIENENEYILELWETNLTSFKKPFIDEKATYNNFEQFLSKMMEIERVFVEADDLRPIISFKKDLKECTVKLKKASGQLMICTLFPFGYWGSWEIFKVDKIDI